MEKLTYSVTEAAELIGIGKSLMYELVRENKIPVVRMGKRILIPKIRFENFINEELNKTI
ncbi:excisionase family DNA binding protein [Mobilisporobacter senegalensis]|uniref:Excisionase family DNA binding protein n=1 Tax=Mobilisporobacter senegalensis TaxID=1329262 RepID=A0A3N1XQH5_9FIRM|nr:excisionase [Mobilisporobacter senegalensis]ROR28518.1 excisionase family DNA binding protein [Mobilisporobacter senegalensis]